MKRRFFSVLTLALFACTLSFSYAYSAETIIVPEQLMNKKVCIVDSTFIGPHDAVLLENAEKMHLNTLENAIANLRSGKTDAIIYDTNVLNYIAARNPDLMVLPEKYFEKNMVFAINPSVPELKGFVDAKIDEMQSNGQLEGMRSYWFSETGVASPMPEILITPKSEGSARLVYGTCGMNEPFAFKGVDGKIIGYDIEMVSFVAQSASLPLFIEVMPPLQLLNAVETGKVSMAGGFMEGSPLLTKALASKPYFKSSVSIMVLKK